MVKHFETPAPAERTTDSEVAEDGTYAGTQRIDGRMTLGVFNDAVKTLVDEDYINEGTEFIAFLEVPGLEQRLEITKISTARESENGPRMVIFSVLPSVFVGR